jgi:hypothetical protein
MNENYLMRTFLVLSLSFVSIANGPLSAQSLPALAPDRHLYVTFSINPGWMNMDYYLAPEIYLSKIFLESGTGVNLNFSIGGKHFGFNMDYCSNHHAIDETKIENESQSVTSFVADPNRLQMDGLLLGPYASVQFGYKQRFQLALKPSIGVMAFEAPQIKIGYSNGVSSVSIGEDNHLTNRLAYSIGGEFNYMVLKPIAIGVFFRQYSFKTFYLDKLKSTQYGFSIACRIEQ